MDNSIIKSESIRRLSFVPTNPIETDSANDKKESIRAKRDWKKRFELKSSKVESCQNVTLL